MRSELERLLRHRWWEDERMFETHVKAIVAMGLKDQEKLELVAMLKECTEPDLVTIYTEVMGRLPDPVFRQPLVDGLSSPKHETRRDAAMALLAGKYEGAAELVLSQPRLIDDMGPELPWMVTEGQLELTDAVKAQLLKACRRHFQNPSSGGQLDSLWLWMLRAVRTTDDGIAEVLLDLWRQQGPRDIQSKYELVTAMAAAPHPSYRPVFEKAAKSRVVDIRKAAQVGLGRLDSEERETPGRR